MELGVRGRRALLLLLVLSRAHASHRRLSLGGLHDADAAVARRAAFVAARAAEPTLSTFSSASCNLTHSTSGYWESCGGAAGNVGSFSRLSAAAASAACCANDACAGFSFGCDDASCATGSGYYKNNLACGFVNSVDQGFAKPSALPVMPVVNVTIVSPDLPLTADVVNVTVSFVFTAGSVNRTTDWVGQVCVGSPIEDYIEFAPVDFFNSWDTPTGGSFTFSIFRMRCDVEFRFFRGVQPLWPSGQAVGVSAPVTWAGPSWGSGVPFHGHLAFGGEDAQHAMVVSFTTNSTPAGDVTVMVGSAPGVYNLPNATDVESTTYGAGDLCNAPANETSVDHWQWPGVFHHVTLRDLEPGTRYWARPVAGELVGEELTFVTGAALSPLARTTFAAYGDMSVTQYVLDGDTQRDMPNGGPGAVGTSQRLRARIDSAGDLDFVLHFGDLGYATGQVFLWDAWMAMMAHVGERVPYMVSIGNHEYDYRDGSPNDPSGVSGGVHHDMPSWFDGDIDSRGECGVGTERRFRSPSTGNKIFWYTFATGSVSVVMLSSEHSVAPGSPQRAFLESALAAVNRTLTPWLVVTFHREVYSLTGDEQALQDGYLAWMEDLFYEFRVDLVANGHIHQSQRTFPVYKYKRVEDAPVYIISGSAGAMLEPYAADNRTGLVAWNGLGTCGFYVVDCVNASHMRLTWSRNNDSAVLDDAWVVRAR